MGDGLGGSTPFSDKAEILAGSVYGIRVEKLTCTLIWDYQNPAKFTVVKVNKNGAEVIGAISYPGSPSPRTVTILGEGDTLMDGERLSVEMDASVITNTPIDFASFGCDLSYREIQCN